LAKTQNFQLIVWHPKLKYLKLLLLLHKIFNLCRNMDPKMGQGIKKAGQLGAAGGDCEAIYWCKEKAQHYRFPGVE